MMCMNRLVATAFAVSLAIILPSIAHTTHTRPVIRPTEQAWQDLVGLRVKGNNLEIWVIKDYRKPCDPKSTDPVVGRKYKVRVKKLTGKKAAKWLAGKHRGLMRRLSDGRYKWNKEKRDAWRFCKSGGHLYWQVCAGSSKCGDKVPYSYRYENLALKWLEEKVYKPRWKKPRIRLKDRPFQIHSGLRREITSPNYSHVHYEGNVKIWENKVICFDGCIMATPENFQGNEQAQRTYKSCMERCRRDNKYMKCPFNMTLDVVD